MFTTTRTTVGFTPNQLRVNLGAITQNYLNIKKCVNAECVANIKANAFDLGIVQIMRCLSKIGCKRFFVDDIATAISLRNLSLTDEIYVLNGVFTGEADDFIQHQIIPVLNNKEQFELFNNYCLRKNKSFEAAINITISTNYIGFPIDEAINLAESSFFKQKINLRLIIIDNNETNLEQVKSIKQLLNLPMASGYKAEDCFDLLNLDIELYGIEQKNTQAALSLYSQVIQLNETKDGRMLATIPLGYAHGISPSLANRGVFYINGTATPIAAPIAIGHTLIDVSAVNSHFLHLGTQVEILGEYSRVEDLAKAANTTSDQVILLLAKGLTKTYI